MKPAKTLLPNYMKYISFVLFGSSALFLILFSSDFIVISPEVARIIFYDLLLIALLVFSLSGVEISDDKSIKLHIGTFVFAFVIAVGFVIIMPLINLVFGKELMDGLGAHQILVLIFAVYLGLYYRRKMAK